MRKKIAGSFGFTLIELLIVVTIIGVLAVLIIFAFNPNEIVKKTRDTNRISELNSVRKAIDIKISSDRSSPTVFTGTSGSSTDAGAQKVDGTGWVKAHLSQHLSALPIDPIQGSDASYRYEFAQANDTYEIRVKLESQEKRDSVGKPDGGDDPDYFELGTNLGLL